MLEEKLIELRQTLFLQSAQVENMFSKIIRSLKSRSQELINEIIEIDEQAVNKLELKIDELCIQLLALYHPEAKDLRLTTMISKMTSDLERIADCLVNIAESLQSLFDKPNILHISELENLSLKTLQMFNSSIASFIEEDVALALSVCREDEVIDSLRDLVWEKIIKDMHENPDSIKDGLAIIRLANNLEKIADISTNIAEETVYLVEGTTIKHHSHLQANTPNNQKTINILFVCIHNSCRSQMAEAFANYYGRPFVQAWSAGIEKGSLNPYAVESMREVGIDISNQRAKSIAEILTSDLKFDYLVTVCDAANSQRCPVVPGQLKRLHWDIRDPATLTGDKDYLLKEFALIRDQIKERVLNLLAEIRATKKA